MPRSLRAAVWIFFSLGGVACAVTLLFLAMRAVMEIGGACAEGGPYVPRQECPDGVPGILVGSIWGGLILAGVYVWNVVRHGVPSFAWLFWPALFLSLGWNFFEYALDPPGEGDGLVWGWLVCGVLFAVMGGGPLVLGRHLLLRAATARAPRRAYWIALQLAAVAGGIAGGALLFDRATA